MIPRVGCGGGRAQSPSLIWNVFIHLFVPCVRIEGCLCSSPRQGLSEQGELGSTQGLKVGLFPAQVPLIGQESEDGWVTT